MRHEPPPQVRHASRGLQGIQGSPEGYLQAVTLQPQSHQGGSPVPPQSPRPQGFAQGAQLRAELPL